MTQRQLKDVDALLRDQDSIAPPLLIPAEDGPVVALPTNDTVDRLTRRELLLEERAIAREFHGGRTWPYAALTLLSFVVWVSLFPLAIMGMLSPLALALACAFSTFYAAYGFVPSHEAMHSNIFPREHKLHWLNELTGHLSTIPIAMGFGVGRLAHMEHHAHCNHPDKDPDFPDDAPDWWRAIIKTWWNRQPGVDGSMRRYLTVVRSLGTPNAHRAVMETLALQLVMLGTFFAMAWTGYAIEVALLWWLPRQLGHSFIRYWASWAPHNPRVQGRYRNTHIFRTIVGHWLSMGMQYHLIHHLYPGIPNHRTREAYEAMKDVLRRQGVDISALS